MTIAEKLYAHVPEYYPTMYLDGFNANEIYYAARKKMLQNKEAKEENEEKDQLQQIKITSEVKIK